MKTFVRRLLLTLVVLYVLGVTAFAFLHYPSGERPGVGTILGDFHDGLTTLFRRKEASEPKPPPETPETTLDGLRGGVGDELDLTMDLGQILVPGTTAHLQAEAAATWNALIPIHAKVLPEGIDDLGRLRSLKQQDKVAFERERQAARDRLAPARRTLLEHTQRKDPLEAAVKMLDILDRLDARLAAL